MTRQILIVTLFSGLIFTSCQSGEKNESAETQNADGATNAVTTGNIPFTKAERYFVKNTVSTIDNPKIETQEQFDAIFGAATTMGKDGKPTEIDFEKQYVIAVTLPETDFSVTIEPLSLIKNEQKEVVLSYKLIIGEKQSHLIKPALAIIVDKLNDGQVVLKKEN
jgi:hypothetical protein